MKIDKLDYTFYKSAYPELKNLSNKQLCFHWYRNGKINNRIPNKNFFYKLYPKFDLEKFKNENINLSNELKNDNQYLIHYHNNIIKENNLNINTTINTNNLLNVKILLSTDVLITTALMLEKHLKSLNLECEIIKELNNSCIDDNKNLYIILYNDRKNNIIPKNYIFFQIEQYSTKNSLVSKFDSRYYDEMNKSSLIFEFCDRNIELYKNFVFPKKIHYQQLPFYNLNNFSSSEFDYDIVFFGAINNRRKNILEKIKNKIGDKYRLKFLYGICGNERDEYLKKSKYVLNIHYYEDSHLENDRFNIALNCDCLIISEDAKVVDYNKNIYKNNISYFNYIENGDDINIDISNIIDLIEFNLRDNIFYEKKNY